MTGTSHAVVLPTGTLRLDVDVARWPLQRLCDFAARRNPRRGFLLVSRVLGRHLPARPAEMRESTCALAALLPPDLPGPVLVLGLAETAVCLGQLLHREWQASSGRDDLYFLHSTRQQVDAPILCCFEEPHSHAAAHLVYRPPTDWPAPRTLVLVDDELSTGTTLSNLARVLVAQWPGVEAIVAAALTDWSGGGWLADLPRPGQTVSLLSGRLDWTPDPAATDATPAVGRNALGRLSSHRNRGRLGWHGGVPDLPPLPATLTAGGPVRIVSTGEFSYPPFLVAEALEARGIDVVVQATTRSPARLGHAMRHAHVFGDNYGADVPNYLYNAPADHVRVSWICHETPPGSIDPALVRALDAHLLAWPA